MWWRGAWIAALLLAGCLERGKAERDEEPLPQQAPVADLVVASRLVPPGAADPDATLRVRLEAEPAHLNPLLAGDALAERLLLGDVYEGLLCAPRPDAAAEPCLAESVSVDESGTRWRFALRDRVRWHDGRPLGPGDVVFTYELLRGPSPASPLLAAELDDLQAVRADGDVVELRFAGRRPGRRGAIARVPILPRHHFGAAEDVLAADASRAPVGTGPLRFVDWQRGERIALERWDGYWGAPARARRIEHLVRPGREQALAELIEGRLDLALQWPGDEALAAAAHDELIAFAHTQPAYLAAVVNTWRPALSTAAARRALVATVDRPALARALTFGRARVVTGPFLPGDGDPDVAPIPFDPAAAARVLGEAPPLELLVPAGSRTTERIADIWAADAAPAVTLQVVRLPYARLLERVRAGDFDLALLAFTTGPEVDLFARFHSSQIGGENLGAVRDAALDRALEAARAASDDDARRAANRRVHRRLHELGAAVFLLSDVRLGLARRDVGGAGDGAEVWGARALWRAR